MAAPQWTAFDSTLLHSGSASVLGVSPGAQDGVAAVTIEDDGVILYNASTKRRIRTWALGSRRTVGLPAVFDADSQQFYLLIRAGESSEDCFLASFSEQSSVKLDDAPKLVVLPPVLAVFGATAAGGRTSAGRSAGGGVIVVLRKGAVRWLRPDGSDQCPAQNGTDGSRAVAAGAIHGPDGTAVVAVARAESGKERSSQTVDLYAAVGTGATAQLRHTASATIDASAGPIAAVAPLDARSVAVLSADGALRVFRSAAALPAASGPAPLSEASAAHVACLLRQQPAESAPRPSKRKAADSAKGASGAAAGSPALALCACPGDYLIVSGLAAGADAGASLSLAEAVSHFAVVVDARFGLVHAAGPVERASQGRGAAPMLCATVSGASADEPLCLAAIGATVRAFPLALPPLVLSAVCGMLSASDRSSLTRAALAPLEGAASAALPAGARRAAAPVWLQPEDGGAKDKGAAAGVRRVDASKLWDEGAMQAQESAELAAATAAMRRLRSRAGESSSAPAAASADDALRQCVQAGAWAELDALFDKGRVTSSAECPELVPALLAAGELRRARRFLAFALDASADVPQALRAALDLARGGSAGGDDLSDLRQSSAQLLAEVERAAAARGPLGAAAALPAARAAVAAVERFSPAEAALLHAVVAARRSDEAAAAAVRALSSDDAVLLLEFLEKWVRVYCEASVPAGAHASPLVPALDRVVSWAAVTLDAFWSTLVFHPHGKDVVRRLSEAVRAYAGVTSKLSALEGCAGDIIAKKPLPAPQGTVSSVYSVEFVDLP